MNRAQGKAIEFTKITHDDLMSFLYEERLRPLIGGRGKGAPKVVSKLGQEATRRLIADIELFVIEQGYGFLGESYRKPGELMREKAWFFHRVAKELNLDKVFLSRPFKAGFLLDQERQREILDKGGLGKLSALPFC